MMREYELTIVARADLPEAELQKIQTKYEEFMTGENGQIILKNVWGARRLAFPIKNTHKAFYINYDFVGKSENVTEMERLMRFDEGILRFLSIKIGENVDVAQRREQIAKQQNALREMREREMRDMAEDRDSAIQA